MSDELTLIAKSSFKIVNFCSVLLGISVGVFLVNMLGKFYLLNSDTAFSFLACVLVGFIVFRVVIVNQHLIQHLFVFGSIQKKALKENSKPETVIGSIILSDAEIRYYFFLLTTLFSYLFSVIALLFNSFVFWSTSLLILKIICGSLIFLNVIVLFLISAKKVVNKKIFKVPDDFEVDPQRQNDVFYELDKSTRKFSNIYK